MLAGSQIGTRAEDSVIPTGLTNPIRRKIGERSASPRFLIPPTGAGGLASAKLRAEMPKIPGINKTALWSTWKIIRAEIRNGSVRDVIDFVDYDIDPDVWIERLLEQIASGRYEPATPFRFTIGKSNGFSRTMTQPNVPDLVLYRTVVDILHRKALRREHSHVYFKRERLQKAQAAAQQQAAQQVQWAGQYRMTSQRSFYNWLCYTQYRKHLLLQAVHPYLVVTDVTNFFDSLLHSHVEEALRGIAVAPRMLGLLFFLLERLSIRQDYASSDAISLPVDEFDCSRTLAHMTLFTHDDAMVELVGEDNYVRWMDDQNFGVASRAQFEGTLGSWEVPGEAPSIPKYEKIKDTLAFRSAASLSP